MKLCCFVSALAFVVLLPDCQFLNICGCIHVHKDFIWCEIYILAHHSAGLICTIDKHKANAAGELSRDTKRLSLLFTLSVLCQTILRGDITAAMQWDNYTSYLHCVPK